MDPKKIIGKLKIAMRKDVNEVWVKVRKRMYDRSNTFLDQYFMWLAKKVINTTQNPFGEPTWPSLNKRTIRQKKHSRFWFFEGEMKAKLLSMDRATKQFGTTAVIRDRREDKKHSFSIKAFRKLPDPDDWNKRNTLEALLGDGNLSMKFRNPNSPDYRPTLGPGLKRFLDAEWEAYMKRQFREISREVKNGSLQ